MFRNKLASEAARHIVVFEFFESLDWVQLNGNVHFENSFPMPLSILEILVLLWTCVSLLVADNYCALDLFKSFKTFKWVVIAICIHTPPCIREAYLTYTSNKLLWKTCTFIKKL